MALLKANLYILLLALIISTGMRVRSASPALEYDVKAAMLLNFTQFVEWPETGNGSTNFTIGVLGRDPFGEILDRLVKDEKVGHRPVEVRRYRYVAEAMNAQILFVSDSEQRNWGQIRKELQSRPILTVSDMPDFAVRGGVIRLYLEDKKVRFKINQEEAKQNGLSISSKLLRLADIVETTRQ